MSKRYDLPDSLVKKYAQMLALFELRDIYVKLPLMNRRAVKCATQAYEIKISFWRDVANLWPEKHWTHATTNGRQAWETKEATK